MIKLTKKQTVHFYMYGEDQLYIKDLLDNFKQKTRYDVTNFTSWIKLLSSIPLKPLSKKGTHIVLLAFDFDKELEIEGKTGYEVLHELKLLSQDIEVILISKGDEANLEEFVEKLPGVTLIKKNENSFMRIHNSIKRIRSHILLEKRKKRFYFWQFVFFIALGLFISFVIIVFFMDRSLLSL